MRVYVLANIAAKIGKARVASIAKKVVILQDNVPKTKKEKADPTTKAVAKGKATEIINKLMTGTINKGITEKRDIIKQTNMREECEMTYKIGGKDVIEDKSHAAIHTNTKGEEAEITALSLIQQAGIIATEDTRLVMIVTMMKGEEGGENTGKIGEVGEMSTTEVTGAILHGLTPRGDID